MAVRDRLKNGPLLAANIGGARAARMEGTAGRRVERARHLAAEAGAQCPLAAAELWRVHG